MPPTPRWKRRLWPCRTCKKHWTASRPKKSLLCPRGSSMSSSRGRAMGSIFARLTVIGLLSAGVAGCFQPVYGDRSLTNSGPGIATALSGVDVQQITAGTGTPEARIAVEVRNDLMFGLSGGQAPAVPTHELRIRLA